MVAKNLKLIFTYFKLNVAKEAQYRVSFVLKILMMIVNNAFFIIQWLIVFSIVPNIGGYGFYDVMLLWALASGSYGVAQTFFAGAYSLTDSIYNGKLDVFLTQPQNALISVSASSTSISALGDVLYTFVALAVIGASWHVYFAIIPFIICSGLIVAAVQVIYSSLSFVIKRGDAVANSVFSTMLKIETYPPHIFNAAVRFLSFTLVPAGFVTFVPVSLLRQFNIWLLLGYIAFTVLIIALAFVAFHFGLKKYNSGSLMGGRL